MGRTADKDKQRVCSFCGNEYSINEGYSLKTKQCFGCDEYDREEPIRRAERERLQRWWETEGRRIDAHLATRYIPTERDFRF